jgi:hypothetical protein
MQDTTTSFLCIKVGFIRTLSESGNNDGYGVNVILVKATIEVMTHNNIFMCECIKVFGKNKFHDY